MKTKKFTKAVYVFFDDQELDSEVAIDLKKIQNEYPDIDLIKANPQKQIEYEVEEIVRNGMSEDVKVEDYIKEATLGLIYLVAA